LRASCNGHAAQGEHRADPNIDGKPLVEKYDAGNDGDYRHQEFGLCCFGRTKTSDHVRIEQETEERACNTPVDQRNRSAPLQTREVEAHRDPGKRYHHEGGHCQPDTGDVETVFRVEILTEVHDSEALPEHPDENQDKPLPAHLSEAGFSGHEEQAGAAKRYRGPNKPARRQAFVFQQKVTENHRGHGRECDEEGRDAARLVLQRGDEEDHRNSGRKYPYDAPMDPERSAPGQSTVTQHGPKKRKHRRERYTDRGIGERVNL